MQNFSVGTCSLCDFRVSCTVKNVMTRQRFIFCRLQVSVSIVQPTPKVLLMQEKLYAILVLSKSEKWINPWRWSSHHWLNTHIVSKLIKEVGSSWRIIFPVFCSMYLNVTGSYFVECKMIYFAHWLYSALRISNDVFEILILLLSSELIDIKN